MLKKLLLPAVFLLVISGYASGCASTQRANKDMQIQQLREQVETLKYELSQKNEEAVGLDEEMRSVPPKKHVSGKNQGGAEYRFDGSRASTKRIQNALKNAGFYKGPIDGKIGKGTKKAIKEFQKANKLKPDGVIGKETILTLKKYMK